MALRGQGMTVGEALSAAGRRYGMAGVVAGAIGLLAAGCGGDTRPAAEDAANTASPVRVSMDSAAVTDVADTFDAGGLVSASTSTEVSSRVVAPVTALRVRAGDRVTAGQTLVVLDARTLGADARRSASAVTAAERALDAARSEHAAAQADLTLAQAWHGRISALRRDNSATAQELDEADARRASAQARLQGAQSRIAQAEAEVAAASAAAEGAQTTASFATVTAPFDGLVTETLVDVGALAQPGRPLLRLDSLGAAEVHVRVDESRAAFVRVGDAVTVAFDDDAVPAVEGSVREVGRAVAADDRAFTVKVALAARTDRRAGSFARVRFRGTARQALTVPVAAVRRQGQVTSVFVVEGAMARTRLVRLAELADTRAEVLAGLEAGERVVAPVPPNLFDRSPVTIAGGTP